MPDKRVQSLDVVRRADGRWVSASDELTVEEPLEIRVKETPLAVLMRTPGDDLALATGFMLTEGIVAAPDQIGAVVSCRDEATGEAMNVVNVSLAGGVAFDSEQFKRNFYASSSCGICGKATIESLTKRAPEIQGDWKLGPEILFNAVRLLREGQGVFDRTGSLHAAGLFDPEGHRLDLAEDVGRHNAVDKIIGRAAMAGTWPLDGAFLMVSGRISFEIVQKALMAAIPVVGAVSGTSSLAVQLARESNMTLAGFIREKTMTIYSRPDRIVSTLE